MKIFANNFQGQPVPFNDHTLCNGGDFYNWDWSNPNFEAETTTGERIPVNRHFSGAAHEGEIIECTESFSVKNKHEHLNFTRDDDWLFENIILNNLND